MAPAAKKRAAAVAAVALALLGACSAVRDERLGERESLLQQDVDLEGNATAGSYPKCQGNQKKGCVECTASWLGYSLTMDSASDENHFTLTVKGGQRIPIVMPTQTFLGHTGDRNCFGYATHQGYQVPAGSDQLVKKYGRSPITKPSEVSWEGFKMAMQREKAIFLGRETKDIQNLKNLPVVEGQKYYIVAAFLTPGEEYHFWGLWNNGWFCVSSKISSLEKDMGYFRHPSKQCLTGSMWMLMKNKNPQYKPDMGGFYLFPCRGSC